MTAARRSGPCEGEGRAVLRITQRWPIWGPTTNGAGLHEDGFGIWPDDDVKSPKGFAAWVHRRTRLVASARTIERHGGVLEGIRDTGHGPVRRYWIALDRRQGRAAMVIGSPPR